MRRWWGSAALAVALVAGPAVPAHAASSSDACGDAVPASKDLSRVDFAYSASSFQVRTILCGTTYESTPSGSWQVVVHLGGLGSPFTLVGIMGDYGKYADWTGFYGCPNDPCPIGSDSSGALIPAGRRIENDDYFAGADQPGLSARSAFGYDSWAHLLPAGTAIPDRMDVWTETRSIGGTPQQIDRAPDSGTASSIRHASPIATTVHVTRGPAPHWAPYGALRLDTGTLLTADGTAIPQRYVAVSPAPYGGSRSASDDSGRWSTTYRVPHNSRVSASFPGDGVHEPATLTYPAYVKALVSLDLAAATTVRRGSSVLLRGVVRPHESGRVDVLVREDKPGAVYRLLRYTSLVQGQYDPYYRTAWSPTVGGRYVLRARWNGGSTAAGSVLSNVSTYRFVTVT